MPKSAEDLDENVLIINCPEAIGAECSRQADSFATMPLVHQELMATFVGLGSGSNSVSRQFTATLLLSIFMHSL